MSGSNIAKLRIILPLYQNYKHIIEFLINIFFSDILFNSSFFAWAVIKQGQFYSSILELHGDTQQTLQSSWEVLITQLCCTDFKYSKRFLGETPTASVIHGNIFTIIPAASPGLWSTVPSSFLAHSLPVIFPFALQIKAYLGMYNFHFKHIFQDWSQKAAQHMKISTWAHRAANPRLLVFVWQTNPLQEKSSANLLKTLLKRTGVGKG